MRAGLVGLPNVGKSTLFNALCRAQLAQASNYPFCTIKPNTADAPIRDPLLAALAAQSRSQRVLGWTLALKDIAGLIKGASSGAGLGNAFLGDIRDTGAIVQVVRCFEDVDVVHVDTTPDPLRDIGTIETELILADLQSVEKRLGAGKKLAAKSPEGALHAAWLAKLQPLLAAGLPARVLAPTVGAREAGAWERLQLLTTKPMLIACNVAEGDMAAGGNAMTAAVADFVRARWAAQAAEAGVPAPPPPPPPTVVCARVEEELALVADEGERAAFLEAYGLRRSALEGLLEGAASLLGVMPFYTSGPEETRAWTVKRGATAPQAAGAIHSDMEAGFIRAEVIGAAELLAAGGEAAARAAGAVRSEGKGYVMKEGEVVLQFHFKAPQGK
jgi:GTP-binding protein YchF